MKKLILSITLCTLLAFSGIAWGNPYNKTNGSSSSDTSQFGRDDATSTIKPVIDNDNLDIGTGTLTAGALIVEDNSVDLGDVTEDYVLTFDASTNTWAGEAASSGFSDPMTTRGDVIVRNAANATARLGIGINGQVLKSDGTDIVWGTIAGSGDVNKVGTPVNNQVGVWTGDGTLEGDADLTFDGTNLALSGTVDGRDVSVDGVKLDTIDNSANNYTHPNHSGDVTSVGDGVQTIANDAVTYAKMQNVVANERILGRVSGADGVIEELTKTQVLTMLNVEDGANVTDTANVTAAGALMNSEVDADIKTLTLPASTTISTFGATIVDDADAAASRTTLGLGTAAIRAVEDTMTDGANLPDGAAIKAYGDANWAGGSGGLGNIVEDTTPQLGGSLDINEKSISYDFGTLAADHTWSGDIITATAGEGLVIGDVCYLKSDGKFWKMDADAAATTAGMCAMATATINTDASGVFLIRGLIRDDSWDGTVGAQLWAPTTPGNPTETQPSGSGDIARLMGYVSHADHIWFNPSDVYVEVP